MGKNIIKKILTCFIISIFSIIYFPFTTIASNDGNDLQVEWFEIMPKLTDKEAEEAEQAVTEVWQTGHKVWETYNQKASELKTSQQIATWIMNRDTIMNYLVFIVQFLSQLWLTVWVWFIMFAWYKYIISVFDWWKTDWAKPAIINAIIWVIIVIFSYAIMRILTSIIWLT